MIRNWLRNFMVGRYGPDQFNIALVVLALIISIVASIVRFYWLTCLSYAILFYAFFRMLSKNIYRRRAENDKFIKIWWPIKSKIKLFFSRLKGSRTHKFFKCPSCKNTLRVPRGKGKMQITCPKCGERFIKKT